MEKLELELATFRKVFNDRIQYFKQLQELSDTVMEVEWDGDVRNAIQSYKAEEDSLITTINRKRAQARHLESLAKDQADGELEEGKHHGHYFGYSFKHSISLLKPGTVFYVEVPFRLG